MCDSRTKIEAIQNVFITGFIVTGLVVLAVSIGSCDNKQRQIEADKQVEIAKAEASKPQSVKFKIVEDK